MSVNTCDDLTSVGDVVDFFGNEDGRHTSMSGNQTNKSNHYRISLHSIDDDELRMFHRDLVTPAPSVCYDDDDIISRNIFKQRPIPARPASRTESVMLFKKINNGDEDVSMDLLSSDLRDFLDTDFMMDSILSRPVSRTTISKNASKIQDINKFRNTLQKRNDLLPKKKLESSALLTVVKDSVTTRDDSSKRYNNYSYITPPKSYKKNQQLETVPESYKKNQQLENVSSSYKKSQQLEAVPKSHKKNQQFDIVPKYHKSNQQLDTVSKSHKINQQLDTVPNLRPKTFTRSFISEPVPEQRFSGSRLREFRLSEPRLSESRLHDARLHESRLHESKFPESRYSEPRLPELRYTEQRLPKPRLPEPRLPESRYSEPKLPESRYSEPKLPELRYSEPRLPESRYSKPRLPESRYSEPRILESRYSEPRLPESSFTEPRLTRKPGFSNDSRTRERDRMRSETVSSSSSSSEEEEFWMQRSSQLLKNIKNDQLQETSGKLKPKSIQEHNYTMPSGHYSSPILNHRYSVPNNRFLHTGEQHAIEYKSLSSSRVKSHYTKTSEVADNAKQVLAGIRERRKSALVLESPKAETSTRFPQNSRPRLQLYRV